MRCSLLSNIQLLPSKSNLSLKAMNTDGSRLTLLPILNREMSSLVSPDCASYAGGAKGKGKRGGARIIYLLIPKPGIVYLFYVYTKGDITDMSPDQKKRLAKAVEDTKKEHQK